MVIGAGAAGLTVAYRLLKSGCSVMVLEARNRVGGRIYTLHDENFSMPVELGAEFIHGELPVTLSYMRKASLELRPAEGQMYQIMRGECVQPESSFGSDWQILMDALQTLSQDIPLRDFLYRFFPEEKYHSLRTAVTRYVEGYDAADIRIASSLAFREEWKNENRAAQFRPAGGYGSLMDYLYREVIESGGTVRLSSPVQSITWRPGHVSVATEDRTAFSAAKAVITIPVSLIQREAIAFVPSLPDYKVAARKIGFGGAIKFLLEFSHPFWENEAPRKLPLINFIFSDATIPTWWSYLPGKAPLLTGWLGGPSARAVSHRKDSELLELATQSLSYIFQYPKHKIFSYLRSWHIANWLNDPYAYGAYAFATVHTPAARKVLAKPVEDTLFFAGEALYDGPEVGTVEAAMASGEVTVQQLTGHV